MGLGLTLRHLCDTQAIVTRLLNTPCKGKRIKVLSGKVRIIVPFDDNVPEHEAHANAAKLLMIRLGLVGCVYGGATPRRDGYCFVVKSNTRPIFEINTTFTYQPVSATSVRVFDCGRYAGMIRSYKRGKYAFYRKGSSRASTDWYPSLEAVMTNLENAP